MNLSFREHNCHVQSYPARKHCYINTGPFNFKVYNNFFSSIGCQSIDRYSIYYHKIYNFQIMKTNTLGIVLNLEWTFQKQKKIFNMKPRKWLQRPRSLSEKPWYGQDTNILCLVITSQYLTTCRLASVAELVSDTSYEKKWRGRCWLWDAGKCQWHVMRPNWIHLNSCWYSSKKYSVCRL